jgi:ABC-type multidrug transport system fused ATPase/permease subunit
LPYFGLVFNSRSLFQKLDDHKLTEIDVNDLRCAIGIVSQEAALFDRSIGENISYGDNSREVTMLEIIKAAKLAEIHDFIATLPDVKRLSLES